MGLQDEILQWLNDEGEGISSGWTFIDRCLRRPGVKKGFLISVIGSKKVGKTYFAMNWIYRLLREQRRVYYFSAEMKRTDAAIRMLQPYTKRNEKQIIEDLQNGGAQKYSAAIKYMDYYCHIDDTSPLPIEYIYEVIQKFPAFDYYIIDHHMKIETDTNDIYNKTTHVFKRLFEAAYNLQARIIVMVHSNKRGSTNFADGSVLPGMSSGAGSGEIERNSDMIMVIANPGMDDKCEPSRRNGLLARVFQGRYNDDSGIIWLPYDPDSSIIKEVIF